MSKFTARDGTGIYYKDWGSGHPVILSHGWPLDADMWEYQMLFLASHGFRVIAYDRRGFGRSDQPWTGYDYDTFADDIADLVDHLELEQFALAGFSMGGGDIVRYVSRHGKGRVSHLALISAVTPIFIRTEDHPEGPDRSLFDGIRAGIAADRPQFLSDFNPLFYGTDKGNVVSKGVFDQTLQMALMGSIKATIDCVTAFSETDFRPDMKNLDMPVLVIHGEADEVVPIEATARLVAAMVPGSILKSYPGAPHATCITHKDQVNLDLLALLRS